MAGFLYRNMHSDSLGLAVKTNPPILPKHENVMVKVPDSHGAKWLRAQYDVAMIPVEIGFATKDIRSYSEKLRVLSNWLDPTEGLGTYVADHEPDKYYEAVLDDSEFDRIEYIARMGKGTLTFICPDPYAYKEEKNLDIDEGLNTVYNGGSADAYPTLKLTVTKDDTLISVKNMMDINNRGDTRGVYMGTETQEGEETRDRKVLLMHDTMESTAGWIESSGALDNGHVTGKMGVMDDGFYVEDWGTEDQSRFDNLKAINDDIDRQREEFMRRVRTIKSDIKRIDDKKNPDQQDKQRRKELMAEKSSIYKDIGKLEEQRRKRISEEVGKGPAVWIGPALERSVVDPVHSFIARFNIANRNEFNFDGSKVPGGVGIMEVYFRDEHGNKICKVSFGDSNGSRETKNSASFVIDDERHSMIWEPSGWNDFHGVMEVVRDTAMWFVKVASTTADGREYKIREIGPIYAEPGGVGENDVKTVQIAIRKYIGSQRIYARFQEMKFWDFIGTYEYPDFRPVHRFDAGDEILINMKNGRVEVNGEKRTDLVLASSEFFKLVKGENTIKLSDNLIGDIIFKERFT